MAEKGLVMFAVFVCGGAYALTAVLGANNPSPAGWMLFMIATVILVICTGFYLTDLVIQEREREKSEQDGGPAR